MSSTDLITLALKILDCSQKELAVRLKVSPTQITKWKKGEYISSEMDKKIRETINLGDKNPTFILLAGSFEEAEKWDKLIHLLAELAYESAETGYRTEPLQDDLGLLCGEIFQLLTDIGVSIPAQFPSEINLEALESDDDEIHEASWEAIDENPFTSLIYDAFEALNDVYGFYAAYIFDLMYDDNLELFDTAADNIEPCLLSLAICKIDVDETFAPNFRKFRYKTLQDYKKWLNIVKEKAFRAGVPLRAELLNLVYDSQGEISHEAEAQSLKVNDSRIHPDIYMNELLTGMRMIHQVLPIIMKKLEIFDDFEIDDSDLRLG